MALDLSAARRVYMFIDGKAEPLNGCLNLNKPTTLRDVVEISRDLQDAFPREKATFEQKKHFRKISLFHQREKMRRLILQRRAKTKYLLVMMSEET